MEYDVIKDKVFTLIKKNSIMRRFFYFALDVLLLRQSHVKRAINKFFHRKDIISMYDGGAGFCQYSDYVLNNWEKSQIFALDLKTNYMESYSEYLKKKRERFQYVGGDLTEYQPDRKFDLIVAIDILEHIEDDIIVLKNFQACLKNKGKLIISTPSNFDESAKFVAEHVRPGYSKEEIITKLEKTGFSIVDFKYTYGFWGHLNWLLMMKFPLSLLSKCKIIGVFLPFYYLLVLPLSTVYKKIDLIIENKIGTGILVVAELNKQ